MASKGMKGLLVWCKKHTEGYRDVKVVNMTSSWKDGLAFCALLHRFRPDLIDFDSLSKENVLYNNNLAFEIAEKELGIAALLDAEDMANMSSPDKLSVMTYLSQYYNCFRNCTPGENTPTVETPVVNPTNTTKSSPARRPTDESICNICGKRVHLVQRYFEEGKLYHRTCHRNKSLEKIRGKNYFLKQTENQGSNTATNDMTDSVDATKKELEKSRPDKTECPEMNLPNLVESLGGAEVQKVQVAASTPSPIVDKKLPNISHTDAPSLVSELPSSKEREDSENETTLVVPKPRTRSNVPSTDDEKTALAAPVAHPRSKSPAQPEKDYDDTLNPFGDSGSDSDTTLSSSSSSEEDTSPKVEETKAEEKNEDAGYGNPFGDDESEEEEGGNPFGDDELEEAGLDMDDGYGNPFGDADEEEAPTPASVKSARYRPGRVNPFTNDGNQTDSQPIGMNEASKKKRPAPIPPKAPPVKPPPPHLNKPKSVIKKAPAPPPPTWKNDASQKMAEMNKANETDPRFANSSSPKPARPISANKSPARNEGKHSSPARRPKKPTTHKTRAAPGYGHPLVKRKVEVKMTEEEITTELKLLDVQLTDYETKGVKLEDMLRFALDNDMEWTNEEDELLQEWFELVNKKNFLLRQESDLVFQMQQQRLEQEHADIEFKLRKLLNKPDTAKTDQDKIDEEELLQKLIEVVERRNVIINSIEEERVKEAEEDSAYEQMKRLQKNPSKKKKKNKVKKIFSKKDKTKKEKKPETKPQS